MQCPACDSELIRTIDTDEEFTYGVGDSAVVLKNRIPVRHCDECELDWTDNVTEDIRTATIEDHKKALDRQEG